MKEVVVHSRVPEPGPLLDAITELAEDEHTEIGLVLLPRLQVRNRDFERVVSEVSRLDAARHPLGGAPFSMAAFHPDAEPRTDDGERLIPFLRRTPDPTIQLVRNSSLERVRDGFQEGTAFVDVEALALRLANPVESVPLRARIARANLKTVLRAGVDEVERSLVAIREDRDAAYARLGT